MILENNKYAWTELEAKKEQLESLIEYKTKGAIIRSKSRWYNEGEKNTKYFLHLEKRNCKQGTINSSSLYSSLVCCIINLI